MTHLISILLILLSVSAYACPDLTGTYICYQGDPKWEHKVGFTRVYKNSFEILLDYKMGRLEKSLIKADGKEKLSKRLTNIYTDLYETVFCDTTGLIKKYRTEVSENSPDVDILTMNVYKVYSLDQNGDLRYSKYNLFSDGESNSFTKTCKRLN